MPEGSTERADRSFEQGRSDLYAAPRGSFGPTALEIAEYGVRRSIRIVVILREGHGSGASCAGERLDGHDHRSVR